MVCQKYTRPLLPLVAQWAEGLDDDAREWFEERAAIYEYEAGMPRTRAELAAQAATERFLASRAQRATQHEKTPESRK